MDPRLPVIALRSFRQHLESGFDIWIVRTGARLFAIFGMIALMLATIGLYGVRAYNVARRTREIGIRMALGAGAADAQKLVLREGVVLTLVGLGLGLAISLAMGQILGSMLSASAGSIRWSSRWRRCCWPRCRCWPVTCPPERPRAWIR